MKLNDAYPSKTLKASDLNGKSVRVTIASIELDKIGDEQKLFVSFVGKEKALVLNKTNALRIAEITGTEETDNWIGWQITLMPTKVDYQGKRVAAIRVDDEPGKSKPPVGRKIEPTRTTDDDPDGAEITEDEIPF